MAQIQQLLETKGTQHLLEAKGPRVQRLLEKGPRVQRLLEGKGPQVQRLLEKGPRAWHLLHVKRSLCYPGSSAVLSSHPSGAEGKE